MPRGVGRQLFCLAFGYLAVVLTALVALPFLPSFQNAGHLERGCYWTDALVGFVVCEGFAGRGVAETLLNLPLRLLYMPMLSVLGGAPWWWIFLAILLWAPIFYFVWWTLRARRRHVSSS
jgi:hypothetical protein